MKIVYEAFEITNYSGGPHQLCLRLQDTAQWRHRHWHPTGRNVEENINNKIRNTFRLGWTPNPIVRPWRTKPTTLSPQTASGRISSTQGKVRRTKRFVSRKRKKSFFLHCVGLCSRPKLFSTSGLVCCDVSRPRSTFQRERRWIDIFQSNPNPSEVKMNFLLKIFLRS